MFITGKNYHLGPKTFWFFFVTHNKVFLSIFGLLILLSYHIRYGIFMPFVRDWLLANYSYIEMSMVAMWLYMILFSFLVVIILRTSVLYRQYRFTLHGNALHIKQGIFLVREHVIPYHQIVNVEINRPYLYAPFGLVQLDIITGQSVEGEVQSDKHKKHNHKRPSILPVLDKARARALSHELMRRSVGEHRAGNQDSAGQSNPRRRRR